LRILAAIFVIALPAGWAAFAATGATDTTKTAPKTVAKKKTVPKATTGKTPAPTSTGSKTGTTAKTAPSSKQTVSSSKRPANSPTTQKKTNTKQQASSRYRRSAQLQPAPDRYKEIQQALVDKGYFAGPVDGNWSPSSVDALKRFQHDQSLTEDGKIGSLSVIALGLGPRRGLAPFAAPARPPDSDPPPGLSSDPPLDPK
jgi:murein L,D-transpeptidase YcbB/YkuD